MCDLAELETWKPYFELTVQLELFNFWTIRSRFEVIIQYYTLFSP